MSLVSGAFIGFLCLLWLIYYGIPQRWKEKAQWLVLLLGSLCFYGLAGYYALFWVLVVAAFAFLGTFEKRLSNVAILLIILSLAVGRYIDFGTINGTDKLYVALGMAFYSLSAISYLIDVKRGIVEAETNPFKLCLYLCFFPQAIQGPITRYSNMKKELFVRHDWNGQFFFFGLQRILWGYFKKLVIADRIAVLVSSFAQREEAGIYLFLALLAYTLQLYGDFSGGVDIAIGVAECFGIKLPENFNHPFRALTIKDFWHRWHMSMSSWFQDYVFYPLSTSKCMRWARKQVNPKRPKLSRQLTIWAPTMVTWALIGLWHGKETSFLLWGLCNGVCIMISDALLRRKGRGEALTSGKGQTTGERRTSGKGAAYVISCFKIIRTVLIVSALRIFDLFTNAGAALNKFAMLFTKWSFKAFHLESFLQLGLKPVDYVILVLATGILIFVGMQDGVREKLANKPVILQYGVTFMLFLMVLLAGRYGIAYEATSFIYSQY